MKILPALTVALALAVAYLIGAGDQPTTAVDTVAPAAVASIPAVAAAAPVVPVAAAAPRSAEEATALAALLAAEDELAERSATVVARATERAGQKPATPAKTAKQATAKPLTPAQLKTAGRGIPHDHECVLQTADAVVYGIVADTDPQCVKWWGADRRGAAPKVAPFAPGPHRGARAEGTCERRAGGIVAEDGTCVGADFYGKPATPKGKAQGKATNADTVPLGEGKTRCPSGYSRDKTDRSLCVAKS